ncbi:MAG: CusA/CzcA family heavy metal efflux RND transporter [Bryobacterales bacterium]
MLKRAIDFPLDNPWIVILGLTVLIGVGVHAMLNIPIDAFPDLTNNQVVVTAEAPGLAAVEVEQLVTFPIESALMGLPNTLEVRSISKYGLSMITVVFEDWVDIFLARQQVTERLAQARERIPAGTEPQLGPLATPFGEVYQYTLEGGDLSARELKTLHDWEIKYQLRAVQGVADVNTWGGFSLRYEVIVDPQKLRSYNIPLRQVFERLRDNNQNFGAGFVEHASEQYTVRGLGWRSRSSRSARSCWAHQGAPIHIHDVAEVRRGSVPRQGAVTRNDKGESLSGMVIMLKGQNSDTVIARVKEAIEKMKIALPKGVELVPFYDQSEVIEGTIHTVRNNLLEGGGLVIIVLLLSLGQWRAALMVAFVVPLSMLAAFIGMRAFGISANLMSLGAVDFGMVVDGAVVMVDNCVHRLQMLKEQGVEEINYLEEMRTAAHEVAVPVLSAVTILIGVYIPILALEGLEGRMFRPMAISVVSAVIGALLIALFAIPAGCRYFLRDVRAEGKEAFFGPLRRVYGRVLETTMNHRVIAAAVALVIVSVAIGSMGFIGAEFMPRLDEGSILVQTIKLPSVSLPESVDLQGDVERVLLKFPEVTRVVSKIGRPDFATEAMGVYEADVYVNLKPHEEWTTAETKEGLIDAMAEALQQVPGVGFNFTQPMAMRLDEAVSGVKADVAVKIFGDDADILEEKADEALRVMRTVPGAADIQREYFSGAAEWRITADREALARYGLNVSDVQDMMQAAIGGKDVSEVIEGRRRFPMAVQLPQWFRSSRDHLADLLLTAPQGELVRLGDVADIQAASGPEVVSREHSQRRIVVQCNVRGRDLASFVKELEHEISTKVDFPTGYFIRIGGQFEHQERAMQRFALVVPAVLAGIFLICFATFRSVGESLLVMLLVPFAAVGGIAALWARGLNMNVSASIGFIAVFGIAIIDGLVLVSTINRKLEEGMPQRQALLEAAKSRLRPVVMVAVVAAIGFLPMATATSTGAEVQRPLATVVIGGVMSAMVLTLLLLPTLFPWFSRRAKAH